ncbi:hypothetical protein ACH5RR_015685 [Cinchona calisaya]|uniref:Uncharacterized protein n=1 Tax=Cinchona calisaya TaxID=153742 RepID=A0ABD2ZVS2_9GENT
MYTTLVLIVVNNYTNKRKRCIFIYYPNKRKRRYLFVYWGSDHQFFFESTLSSALLMAALSKVAFRSGIGFQGERKRSGKIRKEGEQNRGDETIIVGKGRGWRRGKRGGGEDGSTILG